MYRVVLFLLSYLLASGMYAQRVELNYIENAQKSNFENMEFTNFKLLPDEYKIIDIDIIALKSQIETHFGKSYSKNQFSESAPKIALPTPDGEIQDFLLTETLVVAEELLHLYTTRTFKATMVNNPYVHMRMSFGIHGFHAFVFDGGKSYAIESANNKSDNQTHLVFYKKDLDYGGIQCNHDHKHNDSKRRVTGFEGLRSPTLQRTYRLAIIADQTYRDQWGGMPYNFENVLAHFQVGVNLLNGVHNSEVGVRYILVSNEACANADLGANGAQIPGTVHTFINTEIGEANYDVGQSVLWANTGGAAFLGVVCKDASKGGGYSGNDASVNGLYVDYVAHEIGHMLGGNHTFVSMECMTSEDNFRFEPGEGSSIMAYAGVCGAGYQNVSDPFFHAASLQEILAYLTADGGTCGTTISTGNAQGPTANANGNITIPKETPFVLVGSGSDPDGVSFNWQQYDGGGAAKNEPPDCNSTNQPNFRFRPSSAEATRVFPEMSAVLAGNNNGVVYEKLPCVARNMNFRLTVRDLNTNWGRTEFDAMMVTVADTGPFNVTSPNGAESFPGNSSINVTWTVNGTNAHCANVNILLSTNNGGTYTAIGTTYPNNGAANITLPPTITTGARILIQCATTPAEFGVSSTFFDVSDATFNITAPLPVELLTFSSRQVDKNVVLSWKTASEVNNSGFEILHSTNQFDSKSIGFVPGANNSNEILSYEYIDKSPVQGVNYYRLRQVDFDGQFSYSKLVSERIGSDVKEITLYPNPAANELSIVFGSEEMQKNAIISIYDITGQLVMILSGNSETTNISLIDFNTGIYIVEIKSPNSKWHERLVVSK